MNFSSSLIEKAVQEFSKLPGIGKKSALRLVLHMLKKEEFEVVQFAEAMKNMRQQIQFCKECNNVSDGAICSICSSHSRQKHTICVVENIRDLMAIENTQQFNGVYLVLGALISPLDGIGPDQLFLESLVEKAKTGEVQEVILALSPNTNGDTTSFYIQKKLKDYTITITSISRGVAFGGELEFTDDLTLARSIQHRVPISSL
jgi:recombination protein RecR